MKAISHAATIAAVLLWNGTALGETPSSPLYVDAKHLNDICKSSDFEGVLGLCGQYVLGVQDTLSTMRAAGFIRDDQVRYCIPPHTTGVQVVVAVRKYFADHPTEGEQDQHVFAPIPIMNALMSAFPCSNT